MKFKEPISPLENRSDEERIPEAMLMAYLEGKLSEEEQHELERWLGDEGMESDALDGLRALNAVERKGSVDKANRQLRKRLAKGRDRRKRTFTDLSVLVGIILILLLAAVAFLVISFAV